MFKEIKKEDNSYIVLIIIGTSLLVFSLFVPLFVMAFVYGNYEEDKRLDALGTIGDFLAGTTFLIGLSSIIFLVASIHIQKNELKLSRDELSDSINEQIKSNETMKVQQFENTFFNLLNLFNETKNNLSSKNTLPVALSPQKTGDDSFNIFKNFAKDYYHEDEYMPMHLFMDYLNTMKFDEAKLFEDINEVYFQFYGEIYFKEIKELRIFLSDLDSWSLTIDKLPTIKVIRQINQSSANHNSFQKFVIENFDIIINTTKEYLIAMYKRRTSDITRPFENMYLSIHKHIYTHKEFIDVDFYNDLLNNQLTDYERFYLITIAKLSDTNKFIFLLENDSNNLFHERFYHSVGEQIKRNKTF